MLPNFIVCGIQRGGTTSLYNYLRAHPDVFMPEVKEINFFNVYYYEKGRSWYESHFPLSCSQKAVGEASPLCMWHPEVPRHIADLIPIARLIFILRNPIDRAHFNYWFNINRGAQNPNQSFSEAIRARDGYHRYITKGFYYEQIARFLRYFDPAQLHIILSENLASDTSREIGLCFQFLGVNMNCSNDTFQFHNISLSPRGGDVAPIYTGHSQC